MKENKTAGYIKYALGEILLVMIGILLALQVNNWNENRKDREKEEAILKELHFDFKKNLDNFLTVKGYQLNTFNSGSIVFRNINKMNEPASRDSVFKYASGMFGGYPYHPSSGVIESLISTGDINIIRNDSLRKYLVSWKDVFNDYNEEVVFDRNIWTNLIEPYVIHNGDFKDLTNVKNIQLLQDPVFINMLVRKQFFQQNIVNAMQGEDGIEHYLREIVRLSNPNNSSQ